MPNPRGSKPRSYRQSVRAVAAEATGARIVEAFIAALRIKRYSDVSLDAIAAAAGVTRQTIIRRFGNKFGLVLAAVALLEPMVEATRAEAAEDDPADSIRMLIRDYEMTGDLVVNALAEEPYNPELTQVLDHGRARHRRWLETWFGPRLAGLSEELRERRLVQLYAITDVAVWRRLRRDEKRSPDEIAGILTDLMFLVLNADEPERRNADD